MEFISYCEMVETGGDGMVHASVREETMKLRSPQTERDVYPGSDERKEPLTTEALCSYVATKRRKNCKDIP